MFERLIVNYSENQGKYNLINKIFVLFKLKF